MAAIKDKTVLITGASAGIGEACARIFAKAGARVSIAARRLERLEKLADAIGKDGGTCIYSQVDVTKDEEVERFAQKTLQEFGSLDILVNNAGVGSVGRIADIDLDQIRQVMEVNFYGVIRCIQAVVPQMRKQQSGHIINISSVIGKRSIPEIGTYCASKFALHAISDAMRLELKRKGIAVTTVCPGLTDTEFTQQQNRPAGVDPVQVKHYRGQSPEKVAHAIVKAARKQPREIHLTLPGRFLISMERTSPRAVDCMMGLRDLVK